MLFNLCLIPHSALACQCAQVLYPDIALPPPPLESGVSSTVLHQLFSQHHLNSLLHNSSSVDISSIKGPSKFLCIFMNDKRFYLMSTFKAQWSGSWRGPLRECWGGSVTVITVVYSSVFFCQLSGSWRGSLRECWGGSVTVITVVYSSVFFLSAE